MITALQMVQGDGFDALEFLQQNPAWSRAHTFGNPPALVQARDAALALVKAASR